MITLDDLRGERLEDVVELLVFAEAWERRG